jgi:hypothetical protein
LEIIEKRQDSLNRSTGKPLYLEPNRGSLQKPVGGLSALALFTTKNSRSQTEVHALNKGAMVFSHTLVLRYAVFKAEKTLAG